MIFSKKSILIFIFLFLLGLLIYSPIIFHLSPANPDAQVLLPRLDSYSTFNEYFRDLFSFKTFDIQPLRDLSFIVDMSIYKYFGLNSFIFFNLIIWIFILLQVKKIISIQIPDLNKKILDLMIIAIFSYPLFAQSVAWGMARKHLLSVLFILNATNTWLKDKIEIKEKISIALTYTLSILSHPICILWPIWTTIFQKFKNKSLRERIDIQSINLIIMGLFLYINYQYYSNSSLFNQIYGVKTEDIFNIPDKLLSLGHFFFQIFSPYLLAFYYQPGHWSGLVGIAFMVLFFFIIYKSKSWSFAIPWLAYGIFPWAVATSKSNVFYDTYLIIPALSFFIILLFFLKKINLKLINYILMVFIFSWVILSYRNAKNWQSELSLVKMSYSNRQTCSNAFDYLRISYENEKYTDLEEVKNFIFQYDCETLVKDIRDLPNLKTYMLFYEKNLKLEDRIKYLQIYSEYSLLPSMAIASIFIQEGKFSHANDEIKNMLSKWGKIKFKKDNINFVKNILHPYCIKIKNKDCSNFLQSFIIEEKKIIPSENNFAK